MTPMLAPLASGSTAPAEEFDRLLRRAATYCWLARFKEELPKGVDTVNYSEIGNTAGSVWKTLDERGPLTFAVLMEEVNAPQSLFFMAIGWLAREQKLRFEPANGDYLIRLS